MQSLFVIALSLFNTVFKGYLIKTFWAWFVLTQFPSLPTITILPAIGLSMFVSAISPWKNLTQRDLDDAVEGMKERTNLNLINNGAVTLAIAVSLGVGWVLHSLMHYWV